MKVAHRASQIKISITVRTLLQIKNERAFAILSNKINADLYYEYLHRAAIGSLTSA